MTDISDIPQFSLDAPGPLQDQMATALRAALRLEDLASSTNGSAGSLGIDDLGTPALLKIRTINIVHEGASGDEAEDATPFIASAIAKIRALGGGALLIPRGTFSTDSFDYGYLAGGSGKLVVEGDGVASLLKKRVNDGATFFKIGRSSGSNTFQGSVMLRDFALSGIDGGSERVMDLWGLTNSILQGVRCRYGASAIVLNNCVTNTLIGCIGANAVNGLTLIKHVFEDSTYSDPNLNTVVGGAYKDCSGWGIKVLNGTQTVLEGTQIENNGTVGDMNTGGILVDSNAGYLSGVYRLGRAISMRGGWFESCKGRAALVLKAGSSLLEGVHFPNNAEATREIYNDGGKYVILECTMALGRTAGNIEDTANAKAGSLIIGGEIATLIGSIDTSKTSFFEINAGTNEAPNRITLIRGMGSILSKDGKELARVKGVDNSPSGTVINFGVTFKSAPEITLQERGADNSRIFQARVSSPTTTGFTINKLSLTSGSSTISTTSDTVQWEAIGELA
ncbi:hypothetical protein [Rhizobium alvei]|uniref:Pectate lyase superfamily protein domain-containing protein n=1 Tax=Rhizobium alvei TaxID=1132659 RepID=A0ABT8YQ12_9HYPH|nr:hypothetical protein [Rhizobium alvei]MDO6965805.1 hypothetical protein [Rhizobium alvei]